MACCWSVAACGVRNEKPPSQSKRGSWATVVTMVRLPGAAQTGGTVKSCAFSKVALHQVQTSHGSAVGSLPGFGHNMAQCKQQSETVEPHRC